MGHDTLGKFVNGGWPYYHGGGAGVALLALGTFLEIGRGQNRGKVLPAGD